jgi:hypothetical protein
VRGIQGGRGKRQTKEEESQLDEGDLHHAGGDQGQLTRDATNEGLREAEACGGRLGRGECAQK